ncbi:acetate kinase [Amycolatopsis sp. NBRC 101858]|uniref:acetate/propionate family kinase n=1 Tax=Amycolatopsis sp. NBRC 101858 TaxID=3032200 RepID=UPI0024A13A01|nr:acetate kinase [Amycolatopsis sp. NBRC 101858]GLY38184.1 acetate kinase [Amycolatopsis sp. NBRC 101858]
MRVLTLNPGSSSMKVSLVDAGTGVGWVAWDLADPTAVSRAITRWSEVGAVAVRFVHGGSQKTPALVDDALLANLERLTSLAPNHQPLSLRVTREVRRLLPDVPLVACFDTAFHARMPEAAARYPLPRAWTAQNRLRRYGFHGLSCQYALRRTGELLGRRPEDLQIVCAHVGAGVSVTAIRDGHGVDTSMGFTPLEGAMMATRSGSVDPGLLLHVMQTAPMSAAEMADALFHRSGLAGMTGTDGDLRRVLAAAARGEQDAGVALDVYRHRLRREIGAAATSLSQLDAVVFTGGVAEHQPELITSVLDGLGVLGLRAGTVPHTDVDRIITGADSPVPALIVLPREDLELARGAEEALARVSVR